MLSVECETSNTIFSNYCIDTNLFDNFDFYNQLSNNIQFCLTL